MCVVGLPIKAGVKKITYFCSAIFQGREEKVGWLAAHNREVLNL
jgi:hypothetical protein